MVGITMIMGLYGSVTVMFRSISRVLPIVDFIKIIFFLETYYSHFLNGVCCVLELNSSFT